MGGEERGRRPSSRAREQGGTPGGASTASHPASRMSLSVPRQVVPSVSPRAVARTEHVPSAAPVNDPAASPDVAGPSSSALPLEASGLPSSASSTSSQVMARSASKFTKGPAKANVPNACSNCKRAHLACNLERPCRRCVNMGKADTCVDVQHKKRGRPKLRVQPKAEQAEAESSTSGPRSVFPAHPTTVADEGWSGRAYHPYPIPQYPVGNPSPSGMSIPSPSADPNWKWSAGSYVGYRRTSSPPPGFANRTAEIQLPSQAAGAAIYRAPGLLHSPTSEFRPTESTASSFSTRPSLLRSNSSSLPSAVGPIRRTHTRPASGLPSPPLRLAPFDDLVAGRERSLSVSKPYAYPASPVAADRSRPSDPLLRFPDAPQATMLPSWSTRSHFREPTPPSPPRILPPPSEWKERTHPQWGGPSTSIQRQSPSDTYGGRAMTPGSLPASLAQLYAQEASPSPHHYSASSRPYGQSLPASQSAFMICTKTFQCIRASHACSSLLGRDEASLVGRFVTECLHRDDLVVLQQLRSRLLDPVNLSYADELPVEVQTRSANILAEELAFAAPGTIFPTAAVRILKGGSRLETRCHLQIYLGSFFGLNLYDPSSFRYAYLVIRLRNLD